jgi:hypothetical protein
VPLKTNDTVRQTYEMIDNATQIINVLAFLILKEYAKKQNIDAHKFKDDSLKVLFIE